uniref:Uncharacterized protein n=1 Tax=uncultured bacterium Contig224 TaxID=1393538 RepID=W0FN47_9BACT|nr:hypothetical protein [uncultured bacterium Contig224]
MDFMYGPIDTPEPTGLEPLEWDDEVYDDDDDIYYEEPEDEEEEDYEEPGLAGWDDLKPFGSFDDGFGWDDSPW